MKSILKENNQFNFVLVKSGEVSFPPYFLGAKTKKTPRDASCCRWWRDGGVELNEERTRKCLIKKIWERVAEFSFLFSVTSDSILKPKYSEIYFQQRLRVSGNFLFEIGSCLTQVFPYTIHGQYMY